MLSVLYDSSAVLVVSKPAGLSTQAPPGIESLEVRVRAFLTERNTSEHPVYLATPHRLDRPVSGSILFATRKAAARKLSKQFERRQIGKIYWAAVQGPPLPETGVWEDYMSKCPEEARAELVPPEHPAASLARLRFRTIARCADYSLLRLELESGRYHQIRLQASSRGIPIVGDELYGSTVKFGAWPEDVRARSIALHARELGFVDPATKKWVHVTAPFPSDWLEEPFSALLQAGEQALQTLPPSTFDPQNSGRD